MTAAMTHRVVLIDDEDRMVRVVVSWLESLGYSAHGFTEAREAIEFLRGTRADVVIIGAHVEGVSGAQLREEVRRLSAAGERPPAFVGLARPSDGVQGRSGYDAIVARPAPLDALLSAIAHVVPRGDVAS